MKILFLDIDGVVNIQSPSYNTFMKPYGNHIEPHLAIRLNYLIEKSQANIVISSSWRGDMKDLKIQLEGGGFTHWDKVLGCTIQGPVHGIHNVPDDRMIIQQGTGIKFLNFRGDEIQHWLDNTKEDIESYVVIDDEISDIHGRKCTTIPLDRVQRTNSHEGLSHQDVLNILEKLKG